MIGKLLMPTIAELIDAKDFLTLKKELSEFPAVDLAEILEDLDEAQLPVVFRLLSKDKATDVFEHLDVEDQQVLIRTISREETKHILEDMSVDDRTTLLDEVPPEVASQLINLLPCRNAPLPRRFLITPSTASVVSSP